ncbi:hypothetical protein FVEG_16063 [Fusarium verticillioides 7600]|uniref:Uncharacterized protein n=1 Tax=Gibberella moniliformis (strain M3125 / FGSC 7600) TaxID=334819 RepID=W7MHI2_GIBM7|nr:hypothetical protein FVEG_16063 [Fusarium verticillioides 7600]EWG47039.1 hypothetical protein FVEG_16063 [Fusarium verticillioides 7600]
MLTAPVPSHHGGSFYKAFLRQLEGIETRAKVWARQHVPKIFYQNRHCRTLYPTLRHRRASKECNFSDYEGYKLTISLEVFSGVFNKLHRQTFQARHALCQLNQGMLSLYWGQDRSSDRSYYSAFWNVNDDASPQQFPVTFILGEWESIDARHVEEAQSS